MKVCSRADACLSSFSSIMLRYGGGSSGLGCEIVLLMGSEMCVCVCVCVSSVVDYCSLVVRGRIPLYWEI